MLYLDPNTAAFPLSEKFKFITCFVQVSYWTLTLTFYRLLFIINNYHLFTRIVSGEVPQEPVISKLSGHVYEKKLILKYILEDGKDPVTNTHLSEEDLITVQGNYTTHIYVIYY